MKQAAPSSWKSHKLDKLGFVGRGRSRHRPRNEPSLHGGPYPFFQTGDIKAADFWLHRYTQTYSEKGLAQSKLWEPGTLCITIAANIAESAILRRRGCFPDSVVGFVANPAKADVRFIKYCIDTLKLDMQSVSHGTTQDNLSLDKLLRFDFVVPDVDEQRKIAAILSTYDDLIENNRRRIEILEEMARRIYREWFVEFRFPGHENVKFVDSPLGKIPKRWEIRMLGDVLSSLESGRRPKGGIDQNECSVPSVGAENVRGLGYYDFAKEKYVSEEFFVSLRKGKVQNGDVLLYKDGAYIGRSSYFRDGFPHDKCCVNEHVFILRGNSTVTQNLLYLWLQEPATVWAIRATNANAAQPGINQSGVKAIPFLTAPRNLNTAFDSTVEPILALITSFAKRNRNLQKTRDLLLPRLISGELDVSELPIDTGVEDANGA